MEKERRIKTISVIALIVAVLGLTVAFAVLSANLVINGTAKVEAGTWNIYFDNLSEVKLKGKAKEENKPEISETNKTEINNINVALTQPKDEVEYTVDVFNEGNIDAMVSSINKPKLSSEEEKYILFTVTYDDGSELGINDLIKANGREKLKIIIKFKEDVEELPQEDLSVNLSFSIDYVQADDRANESHTGISTTTKKENYEVGEEVTLGTENFYVMKDNGDSLTLLSKYNLLVGNRVIWENLEDVGNILENVKIEAIDSKVDGYGLQNENAKGMFSNSTTSIGGLPFASKDASKKRPESICINSPNNYGCYYGYWADNANLLHEYGENYSADVYNSNSILYSYIEKYKEYLKKLGYDVKEARLTTYDEALELGCNSEGTCSGEKKWVYSSSYWLATAKDSSDVYGIIGTETDGAILPGIIGTETDGAILLYFPFDNDYSFGLRPVIEINKSEL